MTRVIQMDQTGDPSALYTTDMDLPAPKADEVRIRQSLIGVNFVDIYFRKGLYPFPVMPGVPGVEAVGRVCATGKDVSGFDIGERVAYAGFPVGSYRTERNIAANRLIKLPNDLTDEQIAGSLLRGLTAYFLLARVCHVQPGQSILIHAAAGGLGQILTRWAKLSGATTIGTVSTSEKADLARQQGLDHAIFYKEQDFETAIDDLTAGRGVDFAIDGIGGEALVKTIRTTKPFGTTVNIGEVGGALPLIDVRTLSNRFLIRASVLAFANNIQDYHRAAAAWFDILRQSHFPAAHSYSFTNAPQAHADLEAGATSGAIYLQADH
ncbi:quinone oxidoreductase [Thalassospira sp.]|uniref:quinone oxidoreductase family protein n=1 Tax=Thalassospira sp. TaxID=1912094 RepID=UPI0027330F38|nr:quinone oxidoreductase [Thalassospira sp.]MDP2698215.1 quinone oxidoreductase [Thalassospira sp.]